MYYTDENIKNLKRIYDQNSRKQYVRLDLNENPGGLDENFIEQTLKEITPRLRVFTKSGRLFESGFGKYLSCKWIIRGNKIYYRNFYFCWWKDIRGGAYICYV